MAGWPQSRSFWLLLALASQTSAWSAEEKQFAPLKSAATSVNDFLQVGALAALAAIAACWFAASETGKIKFGPIEIPVSGVSYAIVGLTLLHAFYAWSMLLHTAAVLNCKTAQMSRGAWASITDGSIRLLFDMGERHPSGCGFGDLVCSVPSISFKDYLMVAHVSLAVLVFFAVVQWRAPARWPTRITSTILAAVLVSANWWIGSQWALLASDLARTGRNEAGEAGAILRTVVQLDAARSVCLRHP